MRVRFTYIENSVCNSVTVPRSLCSSPLSAKACGRRGTFSELVSSSFFLSVLLSCLAEACVFWRGIQL